jgi:ABC-type branched-subunit amino acid transport system ATPase component
MELGQTFMEGRAADVLADPRIRDAFLGGARRRRPVSATAE